MNQGLIQGNGAPQNDYFRQMWVKTRIGTILDKEDTLANDEQKKKQEKRLLALQQEQHRKIQANDVLEMLRRNNFRGSSHLTGELSSQQRESLGPLIT